MLARELGKYEWEVLEEMPPDEFARWNALFNIEDRERKQHERTAKMKQKRR